MTGFMGTKLRNLNDECTARNENCIHSIKKQLSVQSAFYFLSALSSLPNSTKHLTTNHMIFCAVDSEKQLGNVILPSIFLEEGIK